MDNPPSIWMLTLRIVVIRSILTAINKDRAIYLNIALFLALGWLASSIYGVAGRYSFMVYPGFTLILVVKLSLVFFVFYAIRLILVVRPDRPLSRMLSDLLGWLATPAPYRGFLLLMALSILFSGLSSFKSLIPAFNPYGWDDFLIRMDLLLHGNKAPWLWLQPLLGHGIITAGINFFYNIWFFVMFYVLLWQLFLGYADERRRYVFIQSFIISWCINGCLLAVVFSSVGPCFYGLLYPEGPNPFAPLMHYLQQANSEWPVWAVGTQQMLWNYYTQDALGLGSGISAMPSMHISIAWLIVLTCWHRHRLLRVSALLFFLIILVGSVHLGWHYAVDGYFSIITTTLIWWLVNRLHSKVERA